MHKIPLISFNANQFISTFLYQSLEKAIFYDEKLFFSSRLNERLIRKFFGSENGIIINPHKYRFKLLKVLLEFDSLNVAIAIASFTDADEYTSYLLLKNNNNHYEITVLSEELREIDVSGYEKNVIDKNLNASIIEIIKNKKINNISPYVYNPFYSQEIGGFIYSCRRCSQEFIDVAKLVIKNRVGAKSIDEIYPTAVILNVDTDNPLIDGINFTYNDVTYLYWCFADENSNLDKNNDLGKGEVDLIYLNPILEIANQKFIRGNQDIFAKDDLIKKKDACEKILRLSFEKKYIIKKIIDDGNPNFYFEELGKDCFVLFEEDIYIYVSRNTDIEDYVPFTYDEVIKDSSSFKKAIQDYISTESKEYREFLETSKKFLDKDTTYEEALSLKEKVIKLLSQVVSEDRKKAEFKGLESEINKKVEQLDNVDKKKISKVLRLISDIKDYETYEKYIDDLTCSVDELSEVERSIVKREYENFLDTYGGYSDYDINQKTYRRVFVRKSALEMLRRIDLDESNLKIIEITDAIVDRLKTIPGNELGRYLVSKGLNLPYKKDHAVKKIRIMRNAEYRLLFVYGKDLGEERSENSGAIYIFAVTTHDKDKKELYNLSENRPTTYEINDFIIYPSNKNITIPECTKEQYEIASKYLNRPTITFGCAGSGKTTVSIEQYVSIIYNEFNSVSVGPEELVYVTFHKPLANKVERDLAEYKINGNCYRLEEYFAYVLGVDFDKDKCVNEALFIKWYKKTYSSEALKKNKYGIRERIAYIKDKEDVERLIYTYYRGVFKGSKLLLNAGKPHLSKEEFVNIAMHEEEYLSEEEKETIYNICLEFDEYVKKNGLFSDNDYALNVIRQSHYGLKKTNRIIIDEVQDFTEIEIIATILTLSDNSNNIYYYGDPHQSINPNLFKYETIRQIYYELKKVEPYDSMPLSITYRTNVNLIKYLNKLLEYRKVWIGLTEGGLPKIQMPKQEELSEEENAEDITWAGYVTNVDLYKRYLKAIQIASSSPLVISSRKKY